MPDKVRAAWVRRTLKIVLLVAGLFAVFAAAVLSVALFTSVPDRVAQRALNEALRKSGGKLTIARRRGTLVAGWDLQGVKLELPGQFVLTADRVHLKLAAWPLVAGVVSLSDVRVDRPVLTLERPPPSKSVRTARRRSPPLPVHIRVPGVRITDGTVVLPEPLEAGGGRTFSTISGTLDAFVFGRTVTVEDARLSCAAPAPLPARLSLAGRIAVAFSGRAHYDLRVASVRSKIEAKGSFSEAPERGFVYGADLRLHPVALREAASEWHGAPDLLLDGDLRVDGDLHALRWSGMVEGPSLGTVASKGVLEFGGGSVHARGTATLEGTSVSPFWKPPPGRTIRVGGSGTFDVAMSTRSSVTWRCTLEAHRSLVWGLPVSSASFRASGGSASGRVEGRLDSPLSGPLTASAEWDRTARRWQAGASGDAVPLPELLRKLGLLPDLPAFLRVPAGNWKVGAFRIEEKAGVLNLASNLSGPADGSFDVSAGPLGQGMPVLWTMRIITLDPAPWGLGPAGQLAGDVRFTGPTADEGTLACSVSSSHWAGVEIEPFRGTVTIGPRSGILIRPLTVSTSVGEVSGQAAFHPDGTLDAQARVRISDLSKAGALFGLQGLSGHLDGEASLHLADGRIDLHGEASGANMGYGAATAQHLRVKGSWEASRNLLDVTADWQGLALADNPMGGGGFTLKGPETDANFDFKAAMGKERSLACRARGDWGPRTGRVRLDGLSILFEGKTFEQVRPAFVAWSPSGLQIQGLELLKKKSRLSIDGRVDWSRPEASPSVDAHLSAKHLPLAMLPIPPTAGRIAGYLAADLTWKGTLATPVLTGDAALTQGTYSFADSDIVIAPVTMRMKADGDRLVLTEAHAAAPGGGSADATGFVSMRGFIPVRFKLKAEGKAFPFVVGRDMEGVADLTATLKGTPEKPELEATARVLKGRIQLPDLEQQQPLPSSLTFVNAPRGSPFAARGADTRPIVGRLRGRAHLVSEGDLWVSNQNLLAELTGALDVRFTNRGPAVQGSLNLQNGRYLFQNFKFDIEDSRIYFKGTTDLTPYLDVNATYKATGADITIHLTGPANRPTLTLSSQPPMDEGDILSTLLFGRRSGELSTGENQAFGAAAAALAVQYQASPLMQSVQKEFGLDTLEIGPSAGGGTQVGFSKYLGDRTVLEYKQTFGALPETRLNLRYRINRTLSVQTESTEKGNAGIDLLWEQRY